MSEKSIAKRASQKNALTELFRINGVAVMCAHSGEDDMISLTGIHKASGEGKHKAPYSWMQLPSTKEFLRAFNEMSQNPENPGSEESPVDRAKASGLVKIFRGVHHGGLVTVGAQRRVRSYSHQIQSPWEQRHRPRL